MRWTYCVLGFEAFVNLRINKGFFRFNYIYVKDLKSELLKSTIGAKHPSCVPSPLIMIFLENFIYSPSAVGGYLPRIVSYLLLVFFNNVIFPWHYLGCTKLYQTEIYVHLLWRRELPCLGFPLSYLWRLFWFKFWRQLTHHNCWTDPAVQHNSKNSKFCPFTTDVHTAL